MAKAKTKTNPKTKPTLGIWCTNTKSGCRGELRHGKNHTCGRTSTEKRECNLSSIVAYTNYIRRLNDQRNLQNRLDTLKSWIGSNRAPSELLVDRNPPKRRGSTRKTPSKKKNQKTPRSKR